jgi:toxin FitB
VAGLAVSAAVVSRSSNLVCAQRPEHGSRHATTGNVAELLIDTDVFVDHLRGARELRPKRHRLSYSVITRAELFAGNTATDLCVQLLAPFRELDVNRAVAERAGRIVRAFGTRLPDALIAATVLEHGLGLVTRNRKHFDPIRGVRIRELG